MPGPNMPVHLKHPTRPPDPSAASDRPLVVAHESERLLSWFLLRISFALQQTTRHAVQRDEVQTSHSHPSRTAVLISSTMNRRRVSMIFQ